MKIAVTYDNGNVFQHFGRTEEFKIYNVEGGRVVDSEVMSSNGVGHEALAWLLKEADIDALICGGMGQGAQDALAEAGIEVCAGAEGNADEAVAAFIAGELVNTGVNCDHHDHEHGHDHHHDHDHGCGDAGCDPSGCAGCPGCGGGDFEPMYMFEGTNVGKRVKVHYRGTFDDGSQFDAEPEDAYGMPNPNMVITVKRATVQGLDGIEAGDKVMLADELGRPFDALVTEMDEENITFDCNHEMAGKALNFSIEMLEIN